MAVIPIRINLLQCRLPDRSAYVRLQHAVFHVLEADNGGPARVVDFTIFGVVLLSAVNLAVGRRPAGVLLHQRFRRRVHHPPLVHRLAPRLL